MIPDKHREITLEEGSNYIGLTDQVKGKYSDPFHLGETVIECEEKQHVISWDVWAKWDVCPLCGNPTGNDIGAIPPPPGPKPFKPGYTAGNRNSYYFRTVAVAALVLIALVIAVATIYFVLDTLDTGTSSASVMQQPTTRPSTTPRPVIEPSSANQSQVRPTSTPRPTSTKRPTSLPRPTSTPKSIAPANIRCNGAPTTRLNVGMRASVTYTDGTPGSIRPAPASGQVLGKVPEGGGMDIIGGPRCDNSRIWWRVKTDNGYTGWISEGKPGEYWLEPIN